MKKYAFFLLAAGLFLSACNDKDDDTKVNPVTPEPGFTLHFDSRFGADDFALNKVYVNQNGDSVAVGSLLYFVSNVELVKTDGSAYKVPNSYHLIEVTDQKVREEVKLLNVPEGEYTKLRFMVGVDSTINKSTATPVGDLLISNHMTWDWNTGYIFLNVNGLYYNPANSKFDGLVYEIGKDHSSRVVELNFPAATPKLQIRSESSSEIHVYADVKTIFGGPNTIDVKALPRIDGTPAHSANSVKIADNYAQMFRIDHIHAN